MIEKIFKKFIGRRKEKPFSAWQIELTTRCPLQCKMCIRTETKGWQFQDMSLEDFKKVLPYLNKVETVVLEGWGESLVHKDLLECIRLVKKEGSQVGFVTSAKGLTRTRTCELIEAGLDFIGLSIAGATPETHDAIRVKSHLPEILTAAQWFHEEKKSQKLDRPTIHLVFLMLQDNIVELPKIPSLAREMRIDEVILTNVCHCINTWQEAQRIFLWERDENPHEKILRETEMNAKQLKIRIRRPSIVPIDVPVCEENPLRNLYISVDGEVSPCVYLYPPLPTPFKRIFCSQEYWMEKVSFGNIFKKSFSEIWNGESYKNFRNCFTDRKDKFREFYFSVWDSPKARNFQDTGLPEPPEPCKTCHKILGF